MSSWADIEQALPETVVRQIWEEVGSDILTTPERLKAFVAIAIDHPHYSSATEIADALQETSNRVNPIVFQVKDEARRTRGINLD